MLTSDLIVNSHTREIKKNKFTNAWHTHCKSLTTSMEIQDM